MNINKIFEFFKSEDETNNTTQIVLDGPVMWIGMFKKLILNYETFTKQIINLFRMSNQDLNMDEIERASSYMVYTRAYENIAQLDINNPIHLEAIKSYSDKFFKDAIKISLNYFESIEEYEKCFVLKSIQDIINPS